MTNMTYAQAIDFAIDNLDNAEVIEKLTALKAQLEKRSTSKTPTKTQKENEGIMNTIELVLAETGERMTVTGLISDERLSAYSNQKISALLRLMIKAERVVKTVEKKTAYFEIAK